MIRSTFNRRQILVMALMALSVFSLALPRQASASTSFLSFINSFFPVASSSPVVLPQLELEKITEPALVNIFVHSTGTIMLHDDLNVDWIHYTATPVPLATAYLIPVSGYASDTGFIISPDGDIMTNAHVVTSQNIISATMADLEQTLVAGSLKSLSKADQKTVQNNASTTDGMAKRTAFEALILQDLIQNSSSTVVEEVTVLDPTSTATSVPDLIAAGFPAKVLAANANYASDQNDVAVIKISQSGLPALALASKGSATSTSDSLGAFTASSDGSFSFTSSDSSGLGGSSGSPLINKDGQVVGVLTGYSIVPIAAVWQFLDQASIYPIAGDLYTHFMNGLTLAAESHCADAIGEFNSAKSGNSHFTSSDFVSSHIQDCQALQASGASIDSDMDQFKANLKSIKTPLILIGGGVVLLVLLLIIISIVRRARRNKKNAPASKRMNATNAMNSMNPSGQFGQPPVYKTTMASSATFSGINVMPKAPTANQPMGQMNPPPSPRLVDTPVYAPKIITSQKVQPESKSYTPPVINPAVQSAPIPEPPHPSFTAPDTAFTARPMSTPAPISFSKPAPAPVPISTLASASATVLSTPTAPSNEKTQAAVAYFEKHQKLGMSEAQIFADLRKQGYLDSEIARAFMVVESIGR